MPVEMPDVCDQPVAEAAAAEDQRSIDAFATDDASTQRPACGSALGARTGALITRMPWDRKTSSKLGELAVTVADEKPGWTSPHPPTEPNRGIRITGTHWGRGEEPAFVLRRMFGFRGGEPARMRW